MIRRRFAALAAAALLAAGPALAQEKLPPLRTGVDGTFAPHAMPKLGGGVEGFQIDLFTEVARRMKREITIDAVSFSTLIPGMQSGRYDFIAAPTTVTKERAENMLFTAGYLWTAYQFGIKKGTAPIKDWSDLKGKSVSVNRSIWKPSTPPPSLGMACGAKVPSTPVRSGGSFSWARAEPGPRRSVAIASRTARRRVMSPSTEREFKDAGPTGPR